MVGGMAAMVRMDTAAAFGGLRCGVNSPASCDAPRRIQLRTSLSGQRLARQLRFCPLSVRLKKRAVVAVHTHSPGAPPGSTAPRPLGAETILDDLSRYIYFQTKSALAPYFPEGFDWLDWLPEGIHKRVHNIELPAIILLREVLHFFIFYALFKQVDSICMGLSKLYSSQTGHKDDAEFCYENSSFQALTKPMQMVIVVWAVTRIAHVTAPVLRLNLEVHASAKIRVIGLIVAGTWFLLKWKKLAVDKLATTQRLDAPRIFAFDKVVSLLVYFVAASSIGEVTGFALRSFLAVGGFSGIALGLAAKEIVSNFFGGALLFTTRPFVIGEWIKTGQISGYVQDIGFLQTKILSQERVPMVVPNQNFINQVITNYSRAKNKMMEAEFPIRVQDIFLVRKITQRVLSYLRSHPDVDSSKATPVCYLKSVSPSSCHIAVTCVLRPAGGSEFYKVRQAILLRVAEIIVEEGAMIGSNAMFGVIVPELVHQAEVSAEAVVANN